MESDVQQHSKKKEQPTKRIKGRGFERGKGKSDNNWRRKMI